MKNTTLSLLIIILSNSIIIAQAFEWATSIGGDDIDFGHTITVDDLGNVYTSGHFGGTVDFDPSEDTANLTATGFSDIFIQKLDSEGNLLWAKNMGGNLSDQGYGIALDDSNNIYTTGIFWGIVDFDPNENTVNLAGGSADVFIQKLDPEGNLLWAKNMGGSNVDGGRDINIDNAGNIYTTGYFEGTASFDPNENTTYLIGEGDRDIFIQKLDPEGNLLWAKSMGGIGWDHGVSIKTDNEGNVYITGFFEETVDFDPGEGVENLTSAGNKDIFIQKLDTNGNLLWVKGIGSTEWDSSRSLAIDDFGDIYVTGRFNETVNFNPNTGDSVNLIEVDRSDLFILKMNKEGDLLWAKSIGSTGYDEGISITIDDLGNVYTTGWFEGMVDFDPNENTTYLIGEGDRDIFILKLNTDGNLLWAENFGGTGVNHGGAIAVDNMNNVYATGYFRGTTDFDPGKGINSLFTVGETDAFVLKLNGEIILDLETSSLSRINLYPNPNHGQFQIKLPEGAQNARIQVIDNLGKNVYENNLNTSVNNLDFSHLPIGFYYVKMVLKTGEKYLGKLVLTK